MTTFVGFLPPEYGGYNSCRPLVQRLRQRGDRVVFAGPAHFKDYPLSQGFEYVCPFEELEQQAKEAHERISRLPLLRRLSAMSAHAAEHTERLWQREEEWLREVQADAVIMDPISWLLAAAPLKLGLPIIGLLPTFVAYFNLAEPPVFSPRVPDARPSLRSRLRNLGAWLWLYGQRWLPAALPHLAASFRRGHPLARVRALGGRIKLSEYGYRLQVPEIVMLPGELNFPLGFEPTPRCYLGGYTDPDRAEAELDWSRLDPNKPLAYCALGTNPWAYRQGARLLRAVIDAFCNRPDWQLLVAVGSSAEPQDFQPVPSNIVVAKFVPQLQALKRARILITQGGGASVREALFHGVPMLVFPLYGDQFGLSARIVFHKLGLRGDTRRAEATKIRAMVDELTSSDEITRAVKSMQEIARSERGLDEAVAFIDRYVASRG